VVDTIANHIDLCQYVWVTVGSTDSSTGDASLCCEPQPTRPVLATDDALELASILKALADPIRLRLVSLIRASPTGEVCACDLPELFDRSQPTMSHHLTQLVAAGIVDREQRGKWAWFRLRPAGLDAIAAFVDDSTMTTSP
jgi:ArsR family transcriptional regulator